MKFLSTLTIFLLSVSISICQSLNIPLLTIEESATAYAPVDEIHFTISIQSHDAEIEKVREKNSEIAKSVIKLLKKKKVKKRYIQSKRMNVTRNYVQRSNPRRYDGFNATQDIYVCLKDISKYDDILDDLLTMEIAGINGPHFKSSEYNDAVRKARLEALQKTKSNAMEMAEVLGQSIGKAKLIDANVSRYLSDSAYSTNSMESAHQPDDLSFEIGELKVTATVKVSYQLLDM